MDGHSGGEKRLRLLRDDRQGDPVPPYDMTQPANGAQGDPRLLRCLKYDQSKLTATEERIYSPNAIGSLFRQQYQEPPERYADPREIRRKQLILPTGNVRHRPLLPTLERPDEQPRKRAYSGARELENGTTNLRPRLLHRDTGGRRLKTMRSAAVMVSRKMVSTDDSVPPDRCGAHTPILLYKCIAFKAKPISCQPHTPVIPFLPWTPPVTPDPVT